MLRDLVLTRNPEAPSLSPLPTGHVGVNSLQASQLGILVITLISNPKVLSSSPLPISHIGVNSLMDSLPVSWVF